MASREADGAAMVEAAGWSYIRRTGSNHLLWGCRCGKHRVTTPQSASREFRQVLAAKLRKCPLTLAA